MSLKQKTKDPRPEKAHPATRSTKTPREIAKDQDKDLETEDEDMSDGISALSVSPHSPARKDTELTVPDHSKTSKRLRTDSSNDEETKLDRILSNKEDIMAAIKEIQNTNKKEFQSIRYDKESICRIHQKLDRSDINQIQWTITPNRNTGIGKHFI